MPPQRCPLPWLRLPAALSPASQTVSGTVGTAITATTAFTATNFTGDVVYDLDSRLPPGLSLDTDTGVISGTPTEAQSATTYTVTGEDRSGNSATATVSITVAAPASRAVTGVADGQWHRGYVRSPRQRRLPPQTLRETWSTT